MTVFSRASDRATRNWLIEFEQIYALLAGLFPEVGTGQPPLTVLLFDRREEFDLYRPMKNGRLAEVAGYFTRMPDRGYAALNIDDRRSETRALVYHEAVHWFFSATPGLRPPWLEEGLAEYFSTARIRQNDFAYGDEVEWHVRLLKMGAHMDVARMLAVTRDTPGFDEAARVTPFYATSWLFLHFVVSSREGGGFAALDRYLGLLNEEIPPEEAFRRAFGRDYREMDGALAQYIRSGKFPVTKGKFDAARIDRNLSPQPPSPAEMDLELGYVLTLANRFDQARPLLGKLATTMPENPRVHEALGLLAAQTLEPETARRHFRRALELGSRSYYCHFGPVMAELSYRESRGGRLGMLSPAVARIVADGLIETIRMEPRREEFYRLLSLALLDAQPANEADGQMIRQGIERFPANMDLRLGQALNLHRQGNLDEALAMYDQISGSMRQLSPGTRENAQRNALNLRIDRAFARYKQLLAARDYAGAIEALEERMALTPESRDLPRLQRHRAELEDMRDVAAVDKLRQAGRLSQARPLLERMARESENKAVKQHAAAMLRELEAGPGSGP